MSSVNKRALSSEDLLQTALNLMERLTTASSASVDAASFARDASISLEQTNEVVELLQGVADERSGSHIALDYQDGAITLSAFARDASISLEQTNEVVELLQGVADERSGSHIALDYQDGAITLSGDAGRLDPVRLTPAESLALRRVLTTCNIGDDVRGRVEAALCAGPEADNETTVDKTMGGDRLLGVLTTCNIGDDVRGRVEAALCAGPEADNETTVDKTMGGDRLLGGFYPVISEAIAIGARLAISYRAGDECSPSARLVDPKFIEVSGDAAYLVAWNVEKDAQRSYRLDRIANARAGDECSPSARLVDPKFIEVSGDAAYLVAWNVEKDAQRSYRLDRIANAELTDDSVERHDFSPYSAAESLRAHGADATLRFVNSGELASRDWEGIRRGTADEQEDGSVLVHISYTSVPWLFSQIAAFLTNRGRGGSHRHRRAQEPEKRLQNVGEITAISKWGAHGRPIYYAIPNAPRSLATPEKRLQNVGEITAISKWGAHGRPSYYAIPNAPRSVATLMALAPPLQIPADLTHRDPLRRGGQGIQELLSVPLAHQTRIGQHQHAGVCRRANKTPGSLLHLEHRLR